jgi:undecaprenyl-diphosphatase
VSFGVAHASIAWLRRFVSGHPITYFVGYRLVLAGVLIVALSTGALTAV